MRPGLCRSATTDLGLRVDESSAQHCHFYRYDPRSTRASVPDLNENRDVLWTLHFGCTPSSTLTPLFQNFRDHDSG